MASKVKEALGAPSTWNAQTLRNASNILTGLRPKDLRELPAEAVKDALEELRHVRFSRSQKREIAKKVRESLGDPSTWNESIAEHMGPLVGGLPLHDLRNMSNSAIRSAFKALKDDDNIPPSKRRAILHKAKQAGNLRLAEVGSFLKTFTLKDLDDVDPIVDLGLNETTDSNSTEEQTALPWELSQARKVLKKVENVWGDPGAADSQWSLDNIVRLKGLAIGIWKSLMDSMPEHDMADIVEEFAEHADGFTPGQMKMIIEAYKDKLHLDVPKNFSQLDQIEMESLGRFTFELDENDLENLTPDAGVEAVRQIGVTRLRDRPRGLVERKLATALRLLAKQRGKTELSPEDLTSEDIDDLGNLVLGFSSEELKRIQDTTFKDAIHTLGQTEGFETEQLRVLAEMAKEAYKGSGTAEKAPSKLTDEDVNDLGNILTGFTKDDFTNMDDHIVKDNIDYLGSLPLNKEQAEGLMTQATTAKRKRRATDLSSKTGDELIAMGNTLLALTTTDIATVTNTAFDEAVSAIGAVKGFTGEQLQAWAAKAKQAWNSDVALITSEQLLQLGAISIGFSSDELGKMALTSDDVIESLGSQPVQSEGVVGYTASQLSSALGKVKSAKGKAISGFTGDEIAALKNFALAMTPTETASITNAEFGVAVSTLGGLSGWSADQMVKLKERCLVLYGDLNTWTAAELREAGAAIGGFTSAELTSLNSDLISMVSPTAIASIPSSLFKSFTVDQLKAFDSSQATAVTQTQKDALSVEQLATLQETAGVTQKSGTDTIQTVYICHAILALYLAFMFFIKI